MNPNNDMTKLYSRHVMANKIKRIKINNEYKTQSQFIISTLKFNDFIGYDHILVDICEFLISIINSDAFKPEISYKPFGILIHGPPGTGKSLLPYVISGEFNYPLIKINCSNLNTSIMGITEKKIQKLFSDANIFAHDFLNNNNANKKVIIFIDDIDLLLNKKEESKEYDRKIISEFNNLLDELSKSTQNKLILIGATNNIDVIDPSIRRTGRLDKDIVIGMPNEQSRFKLVQYFISHLSLVHDVSLHEIVRKTPGFVASDLKALVKEALMNSLKRKILSLNEKCDGSINNSQNKLNFYIDFIKYGSKTGICDCKTDETILTTQDFDFALKAVVPSCKREGFYTASSIESIPGSEIHWDVRIGALSKIKEELTLCLRGAVKYPEVYKLYGLPNSGSGVLLVGPPGCGKTLLARAVALESSLNFIAVKGPELLNMYVGETERAVRKCFSRARDSAPCLIFFDEIDSLCPRRGGLSTSNSESGVENSSSRIVNQLLTEMDGLDSRNKVFVMGATNRLDVLDKAILRPGRFDKIFHIDLPTVEERVDILRVIIQECDNISLKSKLEYFENNRESLKSLYCPDVDLNIIARDSRCSGFSGADLSALVKEASRQALKDIIKYHERGKILLDKEGEHFKSIQTPSYTTKRIQLGSFYNQELPDKIHNLVSKPLVKAEHFNIALDLIKPSVSRQERKSKK